MLYIGIIVPIEELEWIDPMVVQDNKIGGIHICIDLHNLNDACIHNPIPTPFTYEIFGEFWRPGSVFLDNWVLRLLPGKYRRGG